MNTRHYDRTFIFTESGNVFSYMDRGTMEGRGEYNFGYDIGIHWVEYCGKESELPNLKKEYPHAGRTKMFTNKLKKYIFDKVEKLEREL